MKESDTSLQIDLLKTVESGGCSAKLSPKDLEGLLKFFPAIKDMNLLVGLNTGDDAGVYKLNDETALIFTTDFFPPVCSEPYQFGQIAAANSLSDVYAMGGKPLLALNLMMFPFDKMNSEVYLDILKGGSDKVLEAGAIIVGGHSITDYPPKYGLAVIGLVHPNRVITNAGAKPGDKLILTKPLGTGIVISGKKLGLSNEESYNKALDTMMQLNDKASEIMQKYDVKAATDITGFGLLGHAYKLGRESHCSIKIYSENVPVIDGIIELADAGCIPGAAFRNMKYIEERTVFSDNIDYNRRMLLCDAQTSGGMLISAPVEKADKMIHELKQYYPLSEMVGEVIEKSQHNIFID